MMMKKLATIAALLIGLSSFQAHAQSTAGPVVTGYWDANGKFVQYGAGGATPANAQPVDRSGTITLGGTAQNVMAANASRHGCLIQNQSAGDEWISELTTAVASEPSLWLPPGGTFTCPTGGISLLAISIYGATTSQAFAAREW